MVPTETESMCKKQLDEYMVHKMPAHGKFNFQAVHSEHTMKLYDVEWMNDYYLALGKFR